MMMMEFGWLYHPRIVDRVMSLCDMPCQIACSPPEVWKMIRCFLPCSQVHLQCCVA
jgi:hypothetical protein